MKKCPVCGSIAFDDMSFCMGCLYTWPEKEDIEEAEPVVEADRPVTDTSKYDKFKSWWLQEGFLRYPGDIARSLFCLDDICEDCFAYRRVKDDFEELIYFVDGVYENRAGEQAEIFAWKALIRKHGETVACEYSHLPDSAFEELMTLEKGCIYT